MSFLISPLKYYGNTWHCVTVRNFILKSTVGAGHMAQQMTQTFWVQFPAPTLQFPTICNSSYEASMPMVHLYIFRWTLKILKEKWMELLKKMYPCLHNIAVPRDRCRTLRFCVHGRKASCICGCDRSHVSVFMKCLRGSSCHHYPPEKPPDNCVLGRLS